MRLNYKSWCLGFTHLMVGGDLDYVAIQEFSCTLFNVRPDIALSVVQTAFESDVRQKLGLITVPCQIIKDMVVLVVMSKFMHIMTSVVSVSWKSYKQRVIIPS